MLSVRTLQRIPLRHMHRTSAALAAQVFRMPAMSPTMTEGGVVAWKYQPGQSFNSGDVLLEVETDKATIDVEAVDDGIMWEILVNDGASGVPVGQPIALLAEEGDDLKTLERPNLEEKETKETKEKEKDTVTKEKETKETRQTEEKEKVAKQTQQTTPSGLSKADPSQKLFPSVEILLHKHHISFEDAIRDIPASGPKGRLLKGDVLAHLGQVQTSSISAITEFLKSRQHLDLSNITLREPEKKAEKVEKAQKAESNIVTFSVEAQEGETLQDVEMNVRYAVHEVFAERFPQYELSPTAEGVQSVDDIFDDLLVAAPTKRRFEVVGIERRGAKEKVVNDAFDELLGLKSPKVKEVKDEKVVVDVKVKVGSVGDSEEFVRRFGEILASGAQ